MQQPRNCNLRGRGVVRLGQPLERSAWLGQLSGREREPGNKGQVILRVVINDVFLCAVGNVVLVLDTHDFDDLLRALNLRDGNFGEPNVADLAFVLQFLELAQRLFRRSPRINAVQLIKINALDLQAAQAHLNALAQLLPPSNRLPQVRALARQAALGGNDQAFGIRMERLGNQVFADLGTIGVRRIDEVHVQIEQALQNAFAFRRIFGAAPNTFAGKLHGAKAQTVDGKLSSNRKSSSSGCIRSFHDKLDSPHQGGASRKICSRPQATVMKQLSREL